MLSLFIYIKAKNRLLLSVQVHVTHAVYKYALLLIYSHDYCYRQFLVLESITASSY